MGMAAADDLVRFLRLVLESRHYELSAPPRVAPDRNESLDATSCPKLSKIASDDAALARHPRSSYGPGSPPESPQVLLRPAIASLALNTLWVSLFPVNPARDIFSSRPLAGFPASTSAVVVRV